MNTVFLTKTNYDYTQFWLTVHDMNSVVFKVKACSDVHVGLAQYSGNYKTNIHEVVIGGWENTKSVIRNAPGDSTYMAEADTIGTQKSCGPVQEPIPQRILKLRLSELSLISIRKVRIILTFLLK